jgi:hypothetical protein
LEPSAGSLPIPFAESLKFEAIPALFFVKHANRFPVGDFGERLFTMRHEMRPAARVMAGIGGIRSSRLAPA